MPVMRRPIDVECPLCASSGLPDSRVRLECGVPPEGTVLTCPRKHMFRLPCGMRERLEKAENHNAALASNNAASSKASSNHGPALDVNTSVQASDEP